MAEIKCNYSIEEVYKSFVEDVEKVKEFLPNKGETEEEHHNRIIRIEV